MLRRGIGFASFVVCVALPLIAPSVLRADDKEALTFEMFEDKDKEFRWRLKHGDDIIATAGQGYKTKASCKKSIEAIKTKATVVE
ncbi:MAG TPA: YegP family protein [Gemmataceae bacterium]|nr:YegP family protein [Gemmataceae bacterium]